MISTFINQGVTCGMLFVVVFLRVKRPSAEASVDVLPCWVKE